MKFTLLAVLLYFIPFDLFSATMSLDKSRIIIDTRERREDLRLYNTSEDFQTYRISLLDFVMDEEGKLVPSDSYIRSAKNYLRIGPRVGKNIAPKESQLFRLMAKRKGMEHGEYRSFLLVESMMEPLSEEELEDKGVVVRSNFKYQIPVIIRHGELTATLDIGDIQLHQAKEQIINNEGNIHQIAEPPKVSFELSRTGNRTIYGRVKVLLNVNDVVQQIAEHGVLAAYPEISRRKFYIPIDELPKEGELIIEFTEEAELGGSLSAQASRII